MEGDDDEEDIDDLEHEFKIEDEQNKEKHLTEALLYGKMSYGRGPDDDENAHFPSIITNARSRPVSTIMKFFFLFFFFKFFILESFQTICNSCR